MSEYVHSPQSDRPSTSFVFQRVPVDLAPDELYHLVFEELYRDWEVQFNQNWYEAELGGSFLLLRDGAFGADSALLGALRLMPHKAREAEGLQIRQVVVNPLHRRGGIGRALMETAEAIGRKEGHRRMWLKAREPAWGFYEKLGYRSVSGVYLSPLTKIPHRTMEKVL
ncbi:MAG: GNAT family N-acetyltransferase [Actinomycetes bacterium]|jgi:GNAT superfamily N-acetyltransferase|nr:GNAT family N-acetyltransferase [Actinomycetes bacterium]